MKKNISLQEKRRYLRLRVYHLVRYRLVSASGNQQPIVASLKDIGGGGICLYTKEHLPVLSVLQLYINFPAFDKPIPSIAKVAWVKEIEKDKRYEAGLEFMEIEEVARRVIIERIASLKEKSSK